MTTCNKDRTDNWKNVQKPKTNHNHLKQLNYYHSQDLIREKKQKHEEWLVMQVTNDHLSLKTADWK